MATDDTRWPGAWYRLRLRVDAVREPQAVLLVTGTGALGTETRPAGRGAIELVCWFGSREAAEAAGAAAAREGCGTARGPVERVTDPGWLERGLAPRAPIRAGRFVVTTEPGPETDGIPVVIPLGRAFGTGEHDTTRLSLVLLDRWMAPGDAVLDLGAGSGILAIAAALGGASRVLAAENDRNVIDVLARNVARNRARGVTVVCGSWSCLAPGARFDLMLANIHKTALVRAAGPLVRRLSGGGRAVLSGFSPADAPEVERAWRAAGARVVDREATEEWAAITVRVER